MKHLILITLIITLTVLSIEAQNYSLDYGKVTKHELESESYPYDKEAPAAFLYNIGRTKFTRNSEGGLQLTTEHKVKIKIYSEAGFDYGQIEILFYDEGFKSERVGDIEAITYNLNKNGQTTANKLHKDDIYIESVSPKYKLVKFAMPNLQVGSVIEYKFTFTSPFLFSYYDWEFQSDIPVKFSKYYAHMIPFYTYSYILQGASKFDYITSYENSGLPNQYAGIEYRDLIYEFLMESIPAFKDEGFTTSSEDYMIKLDFQLSSVTTPSGTKTEYLTTWPNMARDILKEQNFGGYIDAASRKTKDIAQKLQVESKSKKELTEKICDYVKENYSWDHRNRYFADDNVKKFMNAKKGSSANINLFMLGIFNNTDIVAKPAILSTRDHGKIKVDYPFAHFFNYVVVYVEFDSISLLIDATNPLLPFYLLPVNCLNEEGFIIDKKEPFWINLQQGQPSLINHTIVCNPKPDIDSLEISVSTVSSLYDANYYRKKINDDNENLLKFIENKGINIIGTPYTRNFFERSKNYRIGYKGNKPLEYIGHKIYVSPFLNEPPSENPFISINRQYPVDMTYSKKRAYKSIINVPEGYVVDYVPKAESEENILFSFYYNTNISEDRKQIIIEAEYYFKKAVYEVKEYKLIRYYHIKLVEKLNDKISLKEEN